MAYPLPDPLPQYVAFLEERERSPLSIETYLLDLRLFARWFDEANGEPWKPERTTTTDLREFKQHLRVARKNRPATINRKLASLRSFLQWAHSSGRLGDRQPPRVLRSVRRERLGPRWLERRERLALLRAVERGENERDIALLRVLLHTGLRVQELCDLAWSDVRISSRKGRVLVRHGKGAKQREIPLNKEARDAFESLGYVHAVPEPTNGSSRVSAAPSRPGVSRGSSDATPEQAGLDDATPRILRHTFCKTLIDAGAQLQEVALLAGHQNLESTRRYCEPSLLDLENAVDRIAGDA